MNLIKAIVEAIKLNKDKITRPSWGKNGYIGVSENSDIYNPSWCSKESGLLSRFMALDDWEIYEEEKKELKEDASMKILEDIINEATKEMIGAGFNKEEVNTLANEFKEHMKNDN